MVTLGQETALLHLRRQVLAGLADDATLDEYLDLAELSALSAYYGPEMAEALGLSLGKNWFKKVVRSVINVAKKVISVTPIGIVTKAITKLVNKATKKKQEEGAPPPAPPTRPAGVPENAVPEEYSLPDGGTVWCWNVPSDAAHPDGLRWYQYADEPVYTELQWSIRQQQWFPAEGQAAMTKDQARAAVAAAGGPALTSPVVVPAPVAAPVPAAVAQGAATTVVAAKALENVGVALPPAVSSAVQFSQGVLNSLPAGQGQQAVASAAGDLQASANAAGEGAMMKAAIDKAAADAAAPFGIPMWAWIAGGVGLLAAAAGGTYVLATAKKGKR
jgi:hypothetical protein